ncbi:MAG: DUF4185 domain-containing protein [Verrucomicrobia bacterium]|nr:DUF4185 domain-containing protein [Verrucomicrobiota bacterium]
MSLPIAFSLRVRRALGGSSVCAGWIGCLGLGLCLASARADAKAYYEIQVVDQGTGRGVPLVELETVHRVRFVADNAGRVALAEPGWMGQRVFFHVRSHGYEFPKDGFGYAGAVVTPVPGGKAVIELKRLNVAERLYRVTGEGLYRDSVLLGAPVPLAKPLGSAQVVGQDSAFAELYRGKVHWFWGDTSRLRYPLGHFWMAAAVSDLPDQGGLDPALGVDLRYLTDAEGFSRPVCRLGFERGLIWADAFVVLPDESGRERLFCHYAHMESLAKMLGHGLARYHDERAEFERVKELDLADRHLFPGQAHPLRHRIEGAEYLYLGEVFPNVRVRAELSHFLDPARYEAWTCLAPGPVETAAVLRDAAGGVRYVWRPRGVPVDGAREHQLVRAGRLKLAEARHLPVDVDSGQPVVLHRGTVRWNEYRRAWVLIGTQGGGSSYLGEVWYAEAPDPTGPWRRAKKIVTHDRYSFYNPVHHSFFDQDQGRLIYFEGTYANTFSGNPDATPRYDYNQIMYRLDLSDARLRPAQAKSDGPGD